MKDAIVNAVLFIFTPLVMWMQDRAEARHWKEYGRVYKVREAASKAKAM